MIEQSVYLKKLSQKKVSFLKLEQNFKKQQKVDDHLSSIKARRSIKS